MKQVIAFIFFMSQRLYPQEDFFGFALDNGSQENEHSNRRQLGTRVLFREAVDIGYYLSERTSVSVMYDHHSNDGLLGIKQSRKCQFWLTTQLLF